MQQSRTKTRKSRSSTDLTQSSDSDVAADWCFWTTPSRFLDAHVCQSAFAENWLREKVGGQKSRIAVQRLHTQQVSWSINIIVRRIISFRKHSLIWAGFLSLESLAVAQESVSVYMYVKKSSDNESRKFCLNLDSNCSLVYCSLNFDRVTNPWHFSR